MGRRENVLLLVALVAGVQMALVPVTAQAAVDVEGSRGAAEVSTAAIVDLDTDLPPRQAGSEISNSRLADLVDRFATGRPLRVGTSDNGDRVVVLIDHELNSPEMSDVLDVVSATARTTVTSSLVEASVPIDNLTTLASHPGVLYVRPTLLRPRSGNGQQEFSIPQAIDGGETAKTGAEAWHTAGFDGSGVKIGIIDDFDPSVWNAAQVSGEVPVPAGVFCIQLGVTCDIWSTTPGATHGTAVAELVHEMAPGASLFLANERSLGDLVKVVDYFAAQGVQIVNYSATGVFDGPGDGTGPSADVIDYAVSKGIAWVNAAGNLGGGGYWRGAWTDADADNRLEFSPGTEIMGFSCGWSFGLRWDDWYVGNPTDYAIYVWDDIADVWDLNAVKGSSDNLQTTGAPPVEHFGVSCSGAGDYDYLGILLWDAGDGASGDVLEFGVDTFLEYPQNAYSAAIPFGDTANPGAMSVGAIDPPQGFSIADYSSRGPTNDGRVKPDLSAPAGMATFSAGTFAGTSSAAPLVTGAAGLLFGAGLVNSPAGLKTYLLSSSVIDRGPAGPDNDFGAGELFLGDVPNAGPVASDDPYGTTEDTQLVVVAPGMLGNDTDADLDQLTVITFDAPSVEGGAVVVAADGSFTYDPPADYSGTDTFGYTVSDGALTDTATVTIAVGATPDAPVASDDPYRTTEDTQLVVVAPGVLGNDTDVDRDQLTVIAFDATSVEGGAVVAAADGSFTYDPPADFSGTDTFGYTVSDGAFADTATVTITISLPPPPGSGGVGGLISPPAETCPDALQDAGFSDLDGLSDEAKNAINCLVSYGISEGTSGTTFSPLSSVTRWEMALFLTRQVLVHGETMPTATDPRFADIGNLPSTTQDAINQLASLGITTGTTETTFDPGAPVTRWQMALFLTRLANLTSLPLDAAPPVQFVDISGLPESTRLAINQLASAGIARGTAITAYDPYVAVQRWQMALFLTRVLELGGVVPG
jgi:hypothetical protein